MPQRLILVNGNIVTLDSAKPQATALVAGGDAILYVGDDAVARSYREHDSEIIDLKGKLTLPAFTDSHIHFTGFAQSLENVSLGGCTCQEQAIERIRLRALQAPPGEIIWGSGWNNAEWSDTSFPDRLGLDAAAPQNPVILTRKDGHSIWLNFLALQQAHITRETIPPPGGIIDRDADGEPSGILRENAMQLLGASIGAFGAEIREAALLRAIEYAHEAGLTTIHNIEGANSLRAFQSLHAKNKLTLRVVHSLPISSLAAAHQLGIMRGFGDEWLSLRATKIFADGSLGSHTAEMREPFLDAPSTSGVAVTNSDAMNQSAHDAVNAGLDVWIHAIGDYAITRVLDVFAQVRAEGYSDAILRVEHVQHLHPSDVNRFRELNVIASMQPIHLPSDMFVADAILGSERAAWTYAFKSLQDAGAVLAFGSDCPVERIDPLLGIQSAVTRQNADDEPAGGWYPAQEISVSDAVRAYTLGAAQAAGAEQRAGSLSTGKRADVIVLSEDIFQIPAREIRDTKLLYTVSSGNVVYTL